MRLRKKPNLPARIEKCAHLLVTEPESLRGRWLDEYGRDELHIELGCGRGRFTVETAKASPEKLFVALEKTLSAMIIAVERADKEILHNIRFINALADNLAEYFLPGEASRIYINFCDPWPANRHAKRRLTHRRFLELYKHILRPQGEVCFKTDDLALFDFSLREFEHCGFSPVDLTRDLHKDGPVGIMTDYEIKFHSQGLPIYNAQFHTNRPRAFPVSSKNDDSNDY